MYSIVIIDDEKWIRKLIIKLLPVDQYPIHIAGEAEDGEEGLKILQALRPQIVLTDIRMPLLSGLKLIQNIKIILPQSEVIIISGYDNFEYAHKAVRLGVLDFILKPIEETELYRAIGKAVKNLDEKNRLFQERSNLQHKVKRLTTNFLEIEPREFSNVQNGKIRKALKYIHEHFSEPISLNDICDNIVMNCSYFSETFKNEMGIGFNHYLQQLRLDQAIILLQEQTDLSIADIANVTGFQDANYFSRVFKKHFKCTAQEYRGLK